MEEDLKEGGAARGPQQPAQEHEHWPRLEESLKNILFGPEALPSGPPPVKPFQSVPPPAKGKKPWPNKGPKKKTPPAEADDTLESDGPEVKMTRQELRSALLDQCVKEDFALLQVGSENFNEKLTHYRRPEFVSQYLRRNDIRPLKKVTLYCRCHF
jgi:hypothetical protein